MLPLMMLQTTELVTFTSETNSAELLPQDALEPVVAFADLLEAGLQPLPQPVLNDGRPVPVAGNGLPPAVGQGPGSDIPVSRQPLPVAVIEPFMTAVRPAPAAPIALPADGQSPAPPAGEPAPRIPVVQWQPDPPATQRPPAAETLQQALRQAAAAPAAAPPSRVAADAVARPQPVPETAGLLPLREIAIAAGAAGATVERVAAELERQQPARPVVARSARPAATGRASIDGLRGDAALQAAARSGLAQRGPVPIPPAAPAAEPAPLPIDAAAQTELLAGSGPARGQGLQLAVAPLQAAPAQAAASAGPATAAAAQAPIDVPVRDTAWSTALGERVVVMANNQLQTAEIRLTPAELGPLRVQVAVEDGAANVTFHAQHAVTREAIEQALPRLRELLAENGLTLNQADVGERDGPGVQQGHREAAGDGVPGGTASARAEEEPAADAGVSGERPRPRPEGLVDTFA